ncbi:hypothetical protein [Rhizobium leucaenae]|uniref:Uncharacterized protein n=1 Tax=Rhizobium leucaenae TaxID=29450 RepID=A0A7W6ZUV1_9HYPH|nr:hypothetical protein [Rhizobium leucaenae]MBB4569044.1 hypothetical protein [Rhizobium leucaenae]MBB6299873.1 hypothetical protein [Rhizobium leucaenae]
MSLCYPEIIHAFPNWHEHDRFGLVIDETFGGIGATHLLQLATTAYYDVKASRRTTVTVYPEIYAFHIGRGYGAHAHYDFWPARREVILKTSDHREILDAINDRGITRLAVPDRPMRDVEHRPKEEDAAFDRIASAFVYNASGRVSDGDLAIAGNDKRTEHNPRQTLRPLAELSQNRISSATGRPIKEADDAFLHWIRERETDVTDDDRVRVQARRDALKIDGLVEETYRRVSVAEALKRLASAGRTGPS